MVILLICGVIAIVLSAKWAFRFFVHSPSIASLPFKDGKYNFEIVQPGNYAILIMNARLINELQPVNVTVTSGNTIIDVERNLISPRSISNGKISIQYWNYSTDKSGQIEIEFKNLNYVEAKKTMPPLSFFEDPIDHRILELVIIKGFTPLQLFIGFIGFIGGAFCILSAVNSLLE